MSVKRRILGLIATGLLGSAVHGLASPIARASDYEAGCAPACHYETVTVCIPKTVAYTRYVTLFDHCGYPYQVARTCYRTIQVPVQKCVLVCDR
jgi:hypothetical protein